MEEQKQTRSSKELVADTIASVHPEADLTDEEVLFGIIWDDYEKYAELIASREGDIEQALAEGERRGREAAVEERRQVRGDGVPVLGGAPLADPGRANSIFDLAALA